MHDWQAGLVRDSAHDYDIYHHGKGRTDYVESNTYTFRHQCLLIRLTVRRELQGSGWRRKKEIVRKAKLPPVGGIDAILVENQLLGMKRGNSGSIKRL